MTQNPDLVIFKNLIAYYVQRQQLVILALLDIAPPLLAWNPDETLPSKTSIFGIDLAPYVTAYWEREDITQSGIWKHDWEYWRHGIGCRLTHIHTGEYFDWDAPDPDAFYIGHFSRHLVWRIEHESHDTFVKAYLQRQVPFEMLQDLAIHKGLLQMQDNGMYKLTHS